MITRSRLLVGGVLIIGLVLIAFAGRDSTVALDPDSTQPDGAKGLVLLLREFAGTVTVFDSVPDSDTDVAILLSDRLSPSAAGALGRWVDDGGLLVVADPGSPFVPDIVAAVAPDPFGTGDQHDTPGIDRGECDLLALEGFSGLGDVPRVVVDRTVLYDPAGSDAACFGDEGGSYVVMRSVGGGAIIAVGGAAAFTNSELDTADNAVLAVALMVPDPEGSIGVLRRSLRAPLTADTPATGPGQRDRRVGDGSRGLFDLMPDYLRWVALDLAVAWLVYAMAKARRLGSPIIEPQPVAIAGNELVRARGRLLRKVDNSTTVGSLIAGFRLELERGLGASPGISDERLAELAASRSTIDAVAVLDALRARTVNDDRGLVELANRLDRIRNDVLTPRTTT